MAASDYPGFWRAKNYEQKSSVQMNMGQALKVLADLVGPEGKITAIDPDTDRLKIAQEKYASENIVYSKGSAEEMPHGVYDLIYMNYVLNWIKDQDFVFKQAWGLLKKNGVLAMTTLADFDYGDRFFPASKNLVCDEFRKFFLDQLHISKISDLHRFASKNGFEVDHSHQEDVRFTMGITLECFLLQ